MTVRNQSAREVPAAGGAGRRSTGHGRLSRVALATAGTVGAIVLAAALTACSGRPGAAAVVDGTRIPVSDVESATTELAPYFQGVTPSAVVSVLMLEPTVAAAAAENGVTVSDEQADDRLATLAQQNDPDASPTFSDSSRAIVRYTLEASALSKLTNAADVSADLQARVSALDIELNPRYGTLGADNTIGSTVHPWLVAPTADPTAAAQ